MTLILQTRANQRFATTNWLRKLQNQNSRKTASSQCIALIHAAAPPPPPQIVSEFALHCKSFLCFCSSLRRKSHLMRRKFRSFSGRRRCSNSFSLASNLHCCSAAAAETQSSQVRWSVQPCQFAARARSVGRTCANSINSANKRAIRRLQGWSPVRRRVRWFPSFPTVK